MPNWTPPERDEVTVEDAKKLKPKKVKDEGAEPKEKRERTPVQLAMSEAVAASRDYEEAAAAVTRYGQKLAEATKDRDAAQKRLIAARETFSKLTSGAAPAPDLETPVAFEMTPGGLKATGGGPTGDGR